MLAGKRLKIVESVEVDGYTGRTFLGKKLKKVDISMAGGVVYDDTAFAAEIGNLLASRQSEAVSR